jgi:hypothetical protein
MVTANSEIEKSPREISTEIVDEHLDEMMTPREYAATARSLIEAIEKALRDRDERAARIADKFAAQNHEGAVKAARRKDMGTHDVLDSCKREAEAIASAIRGKSK